MTATTARTWAAPDHAAVARYAAAILTSQSSLLPGLSALNAESAMRYVRSLPMRRDWSVVDAWLALGPAAREEWIARTRVDLEATAALA